MASKRRQRKKKCGKKKRYADHKEAKNALWYLANRKGKTGLRIYKCKSCKGYHLGHYKPKNIKQKIWQRIGGEALK